MVHIFYGHYLQNFVSSNEVNDSHFFDSEPFENIIKNALKNRPQERDEHVGSQ